MQSNLKTGNEKSREATVPLAIIAFVKMKKAFPFVAILLLAGCQGYKVENSKWSFVQWDEGRGRTVNEIQGADQNTFKPINTEYGKDNKHVYLNGGIIEGADQNTFALLGNHYGKDGQKVFFQDQQIANADPNTFQIIEYGWGKDKNDVYCGSQPLKVVDVASFRLLHTGILNGWAKDKSDYYHFGHTGKIDCDYPTMKILNGSYAIDKNRAYCDGTPIEGIDVKTFRAIDEVSAKDCYRDYLLERPKTNFYIKGTPLKSPP